MNKTIRIPATLEAVSRMTAMLENTLAALSLEERTSIVLAIQELCVNIVRHAYAGAAGDIELVLRIDDDGWLILVVNDTAPNAYVPSEKAPNVDPEALQEHGMGLFIINQSFDEVIYESLEGGNRWRLIRMLGA